VEWGGKIRSFVTADVTMANLGKILARNITPESHLMTDSSPLYRLSPITKPFACGIYGTFRNVSRKHLHRYVAEFDFRWNTRKVDDGERLAHAILSAEGKRLCSRERVATLPPTPAQGTPF
jgi:hypothetical protein